MTLQNTTTLWRKITQAGGIESYINQQLLERGFLVERSDTSNMNKRELAAYKKSLKEEAIEKKKLKKESWNAYRENHIVHLGDQLYWNDYDITDQYDLEHAEIRIQDNELPAIETPLDLAELLDISIRELRWFCYHRDAATHLHYHRFTIPKSDGSARAIWAPLPKLKAVQRTVLRKIVERLLVHGATHGFYSGRSTYTNALQHQHSDILVKMDIRHFFPTITFPRVKGVFRKAGYRKQISTLLAALCTESPREMVMHNDKKYYIALGPRCLPQGAPTSPGLTNVLCLSLDRRLESLCNKNGWRYTRYADDLTFSLTADFQSELSVSSLLGTVNTIVKDEGFQLNGKKTRVLRKGNRQKVTGLVVNDTLPPRPPRKLKRQIRAAIHNLKNGKSLKEGESIAKLKGYIAYINMCQPELGKKMLDEINAVV